MWRDSDAVAVREADAGDQGRAKSQSRLLL